MPDSKFTILDRVSVKHQDSDEHGRAGVVMQVRRYGDGRHSYILGAMTDGEIGGLYPESWLEKAGDRANLADFSSRSQLPSAVTPAIKRDHRFAQRRHGTTASTRVTAAGIVVGRDEYLVLDDLEWHL